MRSPVADIDIRRPCHTKKGKKRKKGKALNTRALTPHLLSLSASLSLANTLFLSLLFYCPSSPTPPSTCTALYEQAPPLALSCRPNPCALTRHPSPLTPITHRSPLTLHPSPLSPHPSTLNDTIPTSTASSSRAETTASSLARGASSSNPCRTCANKRRELRFQSGGGKGGGGGA